jgi:hypothetical protein
MSAVDPEQVFAALERQRRSGQLSKAVSQAAVRYQASQAHPGCLDAISADGTRCVGRFQHGAFVPLDAAASGRPNKELSYLLDHSNLSQLKC